MSFDDRGIVKVRDEQVAWRRLEDRIVVLDLRTNAYLSINASGIALWEDLVAGSSSRALEQRLVTTYGIDDRRAAQDVTSFLDRLSQADLLA